MRLKTLNALSFVGALLLAGCASGPKYAEVEPRIPPVPSDQGRIYVYRPSFVGAAVQPQVRLNEEVVGKAVAQGFFFIDREPGDCVIACSTEEEHRLSFALEPGQVRYVKLILQMGFFMGHVLPELVDPETGESELAKTKYIGDEGVLLPESAPEG